MYSTAYFYLIRDGRNFQVLRPKTAYYTFMLFCMVDNELSIKRFFDKSNNLSGLQYEKMYQRKLVMNLSKPQTF